jgi:hypothetical protein
MLPTLLIGILATAVLDLWCVLRERLIGTPFPDYALVGRWIGGLPRGQFVHDAIATSPPVAAERAIGWIAHYIIGIGFAALLLAIWPGWLSEPTLLPALIVGIGGAAAPLFVQQPGMGMGIAGSRTRDPWASRLRTLVSHAMFGLGLYAAGWAVRAIGV